MEQGSGAEERGSRTHQGLLATPAGFEVRPFHQESVLFQKNSVNQTDMRTEPRYA